MKKTILIAAICFTSHICLAQLTTNLAVLPQPSGSLYNWGTREVTYIISNQAGSVVRNAVIKATLKTTDGTVVGTTNLAKARVRTIGPGTTIFYAADVMPLEIMMFNGKYKSSLEKSGKLPADNYQLCVQLVTAIDFLPVSEERCRIFTLAAFQLPIPVMPANEITLDAKQAQTAITFRWTPVSPRPAFPITYRIMVFEVLDKQHPVQAMRSNQPLLVKDVIGATQYIWQPQLGMIDCCPDLEPDIDTLKAQKAGISTSRSNLRGKGNIKEDRTDSLTVRQTGFITSGTTIDTKGNIKEVTTDSLTISKTGFVTSGTTINTNGNKKNEERYATDSLTATKAGISTSRSNLRGKQPVSSDAKGTGKKFVWVVQALDDRGLPFSDGNVNGDGISEPAVFSIGKK